MDTSALIKHYIPEVGTAWIQSLIVPANIIAICELTPVECFSAIARRQRNSRLTSATAITLRAGFLTDYASLYLSVALELPVMVRARDLVNRHSLRALDAVQLSAALELQPLFGQAPIFLSADNDLLTAATGEGLITDNPLNHP